MCPSKIHLFHNEFHNEYCNSLILRHVSYFDISKLEMGFIIAGMSYWKHLKNSEWHLKSDALRVYKKVFFPIKRGNFFSLSVTQLPHTQTNPKCVAP